MPTEKNVTQDLSLLRQAQKDLIRPHDSSSGADAPPKTRLKPLTLDSDKYIPKLTLPDASYGMAPTSPLSVASDFCA